MDCHFEVVFAQQFVATERKPIATSGPSSNEITASHFVAESLMQFSRPIVVTEPPHRRAVAITNSYAYVPSIYLLSHALVS